MSALEPPSPSPARPADDVLPLEHLQVLRLEPGDILVFTFPGSMSVAHTESVLESMHREFPGHKALVIDQGGLLGVIRAEQSDGDVSA